MDRFLNVLRTHSAAQDAQVGRARWGTVTSYDPARYVARVLLQPEGVLTGWLPIVSPLVGAGWGLVAPLVAGQQVLVVADNGDAQHGVILGGTWSAASQMATPGGTAPQPGELAVQSQAGAWTKWAADGSITLTAQSGASVVLDAGGKITATDAAGTVLSMTDDGNVTIAGNLVVNGNTTLNGSLTGGNYGASAINLYASSAEIRTTGTTQIVAPSIQMGP